ncbi:MAG: phosphotransferase [Acidobacteriota bacterium]
MGEEYPTALAARIMPFFDLPFPREAYDVPDRGNIHQHTFLIRSGLPPGTAEFLLQRINQQVFTRPPGVMASMVACLRAQERNLERGVVPADSGWEPIRLIPTRSGAPYLEHENRRGKTYWRMMVKISDCVTYKSLSEVPDRRRRIALAEEAGRGLAMYLDLTTGMDVAGLIHPLPGYRDTRLYYDQLKSVLRGCRTAEEAADLLPADEVLRQSTERHFLNHLPPAEQERRRRDPELQPFIDLACASEAFGLMLARERAAGRIRTVAIHGDTKLDNFLFCARTGRVKSLVDLDTIMPHTWLADWGDMVRSLVNVAGEKERDLGRVDVDMGVYDALAKGFLGTVRRAAEAEIELMVDAVEIIALELGVRFLADFLRGDSYFRLDLTDPPDLNKCRAMVQLRLFQVLGAKHEQALECVAKHRRRHA